jgi:hypothetical protein
VIAILLVLCPILLMFDTRLGYACIAIAIVLLYMKRMESAAALSRRTSRRED